MNCDATRAIVDLYAEKRLSARWTKRVEAHLSRCAACARVAAALRPAASPAAAPASLKDRLLRAAASPAPALPALPPLSRRDSAGAELLALALAVGLLALLHAATPKIDSRRPVQRPVAALWRLP